MRPDPIPDARSSMRTGLRLRAEPTDHEVASMMRFLEAEGGGERAGAVMPGHLEYE